MQKTNWRDRVRNEELLKRVKEERNNLHTIKRRRANNWPHPVGKLSYKTLLQERQKGWENEEEDVSSCWMILKKRECTGN